jgi:hypothetical protein
MIHEKISLWSDRPHITLSTYVSENSPELRNFKKKAVLVLPGGGYYITSDREAEPVAKAFFAAGMNAFVLRYSVKEEAVGYAPLLDAAMAIKYIRDRAEEWNIDKNKIPFELHVFPHGAHGLSTATSEVAPNDAMAMPYVARWVEMAIKWIDEILFG